MTLFLGFVFVLAFLRNLLIMTHVFGSKLHFLALPLIYFWSQLLISPLQIGQDASTPLIIHSLMHLLWKLLCPHSNFSAIKFFAFCPGIPFQKHGSLQIEHSFSSKSYIGSLILLCRDSICVKCSVSATESSGFEISYKTLLNFSIFCNRIRASS